MRQQCIEGKQLTRKLALISDPEVGYPSYVPTPMRRSLGAWRNHSTGQHSKLTILSNSTTSKNPLTTSAYLLLGLFAWGDGVCTVSAVREQSSVRASACKQPFRLVRNPHIFLWHIHHPQGRRSRASQLGLPQDLTAQVSAPPQGMTRTMVLEHRSIPHGPGCRLEGTRSVPLRETSKGDVLFSWYS